MIKTGLYHFLDIFFFAFHTCIILFNLTGWIWRRTRIAHLILIGLTAFSWFFLGIWYGFGYCPSTDWHWQVREKLGNRDMPASYIQFLVKSLTKLDLPDRTVDTVVVICLVVPIILSITLLARDIRKKRAHPTKSHPPATSLLHRERK